MAESKIFVNTIGLSLRYEVLNQSNEAENVSTYTTITISLKKPDKTILTKIGVFVNDGTDGLIEYITESGDLDMAGIWETQLFLKKTGEEFYSEWESFRVYKNIQNL